MPVTLFLIILTCVALAGLLASLICHFINPDLGEIVTNISFTVLLTLVVVGLIGFTADPSQENIAGTQPSVVDSSAIHTIQIVESDGSVSFEYHGDADVEIQPDRITLYDDGRVWTVFKNQGSTLVLENLKQK